MNEEKKENNEQKLIDIMFQISSSMHLNDNFNQMSHEEVMSWVAKQLNHCGFKTEPCGSSWGVLVNK